MGHTDGVVIQRLSWRILTIFILALSTSAQATPNREFVDVRGHAQVIDGDTIAIGQQIIRLLSIDAPERAQRCKDKNGNTYRCGRTSKNFIGSLIQHEVICIGHQYDAYHRLLAHCQSNGVDINRSMIASGHAVVFRKYSNEYDDEERQAKEKKLGIWAGPFQMPSEFRANRWANAIDQSSSLECPIKGNINTKGARIYHMPWSRSYQRTRINPGKGERWFCSEEEAQAAGWRAPRR